MLDCETCDTFEDEYIPETAKTVNLFLRLVHRFTSFNSFFLWPPLLLFFPLYKRNATLRGPGPWNEGYPTPLA